MIVIVQKFDTSVSQILKSLLNDCDTGFQLKRIVTVPHVGQETCSLFPVNLI